MSGYCTAATRHEWHGPYHDREYGFPARDDAALVGGGRSIPPASAWLTIAKKRATFRAATRPG